MGTAQNFNLKKKSILINENTQIELLLLTESDVGIAYNISRSSVRKLMDAGYLKSCHIGKSLRFHREDVEELAAGIRRGLLIEF